MSSATIHHFSSHSSPSALMNAYERDVEAAASTAKQQAGQPTIGSQTASPAVHHLSSGATAPQFAADQSYPGDTVNPAVAAELTQRLTNNKPDPAVHHNSSLPAPLASNIAASQKLHATCHMPQAPTSHNREHSNLSPTQTEVASQLAQGASVSAAARTAGIHRTTIHHWQRTSEEFNTALEQARSEYAETLNDEMHDLAAESVRALRDLLTDPNTPPAVRLRTALAILERPHFPHPGWHLPAEIRPQHERQFLDRMAAVEADYNILRMSRSLSEAAPVHHNSSQNDLAELMSLMNAPIPAAMANARPARNSLCSCGSGKKYKRCCGPDAPPALSGVA